MVLLLLTLLSAARAQAEAAPPAGPAMPEGWQESGEELVIVADRDLVQSREVLEQQILNQGFRRRVRHRNRTVFPRPALWKTKVVLYDDGLVDVRTHGIVPMFLMPQVYTDMHGNRHYDAKVAGVFQGPRGVRNADGRVYAAIGPDLASWRDALWAQHLAERRLVLREQVLAAWNDGVSPQGAALPDASSRRAWLLAAWLNTADNGAGEAVRADLEAFIDQVVQRSQTPFTAEEVAVANARRGFSRPLAPVGL